MRRTGSKQTRLSATVLRVYYEGPEICPEDIFACNTVGDFLPELFR